MEYLMGTHPLFFASKVLRELGRRPYLVCAGYLAAGFIQAAVRREKRVCDPELIRYIRREQLSRLLARRVGRRDPAVEREGSH